MSMTGPRSENHNVSTVNLTAALKKKIAEQDGKKEMMVWKRIKQLEGDICTLEAGTIKQKQGNPTVS